MDLDEVDGVEVLTEELADGGLQAEDSLVGGCAQVDDAVVKAGLHLNNDLLELFALLLLNELLSVVLTQSLGLSGLQLSNGILHLEGQILPRSAHNMERQHLQFDLDGALLDIH